MTLTATAWSTLQGYRNDILPAGLVMVPHVFLDQLNAPKPRSYAVLLLQRLFGIAEFERSANG